jgi:hypothetical protein
VLEGLDAAVSVLSVQQAELLFANRSYRLWFGADARGHAQLAGEPSPTLRERGRRHAMESLGGLPTTELTEAGADSTRGATSSAAQVVRRAHALPAVDRRPAGADAHRHRHHGAPQCRAAGRRHQAERAQVTSRLVTMGEMASSVAHELNQPLTAITNYCNGMITRVRNDHLEGRPAAALEKTARQAQRAGQIIHRIRAFVKRSEPQRQPVAGGRSSRTRSTWPASSCGAATWRSHTYVAQRLPAMLVDPILIEQVLLNLVKNAAEAIDNAKLPPSSGATSNCAWCRGTPRRRGHHRVHGDRHGPRPARRGDRPDVRGILLDQGRRPGHRTVAVPLIIESHRGRIKAQNLYNGEPSWLPFLVHDAGRYPRSEAEPTATAPPTPPPSS